jgi:hypothetical protein
MRNARTAFASVSSLLILVVFAGCSVVPQLESNVTAFHTLPAIRQYQEGYLSFLRRISHLRSSFKVTHPTFIRLLNRRASPGRLPFKTLIISSSFPTESILEGTTFLLLPFSDRREAERHFTMDRSTALEAMLRILVRHTLRPHLA